MKGFALTLFSSVGHLWIMIFVINRLHSLAIPHRRMKLIDCAWYFVTLGPPLLAMLSLWPDSLTAYLPAVDNAVEIFRPLRPWFLYLGCVGFGAGIVRWVRRRWFLQQARELLSDEAEIVDGVGEIGHPPIGSLSTQLAMFVPGNQVFDVAIHRKQIHLPRMSTNLDGATVTHLSDLHFTGRVTAPYFELIVKLSNQLNSDMVIVTGDIIDKVECFDWLGDILGQLRAKHGVYFVLGNHDLRVDDENRVRSSLTQAGLVDLGKRWTSIEVHGESVLLAGNEEPWFRPAADLSAIQLDSYALKLGIAHSPDRLPWAKKNGLDLLLAGHTHGGQVRLPIVGPVFSPSRYGVTYCGGTFAEEPTVMHVSRGVSGTRALRINCPPELAQLTLRSSKSRGTSTP